MEHTSTSLKSEDRHQFTNPHTGVLPPPHKKSRLLLCWPDAIVKPCRPSRLASIRRIQLGSFSKFVWNLSVSFEIRHSEDWGGQYPWLLLF